MAGVTGRSGVRRRSGWRVAIWGAIALLLLLPLIAMRFTGEVRWNAADFAAAALLLVGAGGAFEALMHYTADTGRRVAIGAAIVFAVLLIWAQGAVGIF